MQHQPLDCESPRPQQNLVAQDALGRIVLGAWTLVVTSITSAVFVFTLDHPSPWQRGAMILMGFLLIGNFGTNTHSFHCAAADPLVPKSQGVTLMVEEGMNDEPIQTDEVVAQISRSGECALVHQGAGVEVVLFHERSNEREPYAILSRLSEIPQSPKMAKALELGFALRRSVDGTAYELARRCFGIRAAAQSALMLAQILAGSGPDAKLWITFVEPDNRDASPEVQPDRPPGGS